MTEQKIKEIFSNEEFVTSLMNMENPEDVQKALAEQGLELSIEEIEKIRQVAIDQEGELSEEDLEGVAGGSVAAIVLGVIAGITSLFKLGRSVNSWTRSRW